MKTHPLHTNQENQYRKCDTVMVARDCMNIVYVESIENGTIGIVLENPDRSSPTRCKILLETGQICNMHFLDLKPVNFAS